MTAQTTAHTPARINPDHLAVLIVATVLTAALAATSFMLSFAALEAVAEWAAVPPALTWAVPVFIDAAILVYTLAALVARARGESAKAPWSSLALWTAVSVTANALHAWSDIPDDVRTIAGMTIAGLAPIAVLLATHTLADLVVAKPVTTAASAAGADGQVDARTDGDADVDGRTPDPLVVLEEIKQAGPEVAVVDELVVATASADIVDGRVDSDADIRAVSVRRSRSSASVEAVRREIERRAREGASGREIARQLGLGRTRVCEIVRELKTAGDRFDPVQETHAA